MTHDNAVATGATERYALDEMEVGEEREFEQHYFACVVCAVDVQAAIDVKDVLVASAAEGRQ